MNSDSVTTLSPKILTCEVYEYNAYDFISNDGRSTARNSVKTMV